MVVVVAAFGQMVHQLEILAPWDQVADRLVILMEPHIHLLLDKDIRAAKADIILPILLNIQEQVVAAAQANKAALEYIIIQIEDLRELVVKVAIMNGTVPMLQTQDGLPDQQHGDMVVMA
jgi:hypothetical protein